MKLSYRPNKFIRQWMSEHSEDNIRAAEERFIDYVEVILEIAAKMHGTMNTDSVDEQPLEGVP